LEPVVTEQIEEHAVEAVVGDIVMFPCRSSGRRGVALVVAQVREHVPDAVFILGTKDFSAMGLRAHR
jgi:hypothetical protein